MKQVILDTNALLAIANLKLDLFTALDECCDFSFKIAVTQGTINELVKIQQEQRGKYSAAAKLGLQLLTKKNVKIIKNEDFVDDVLVEMSKKGHLVLTQDKELKKRLTKPYLTIRQKKKVIMVK